MQATRSVVWGVQERDPDPAESSPTMIPGRKLQWDGERPELLIDLKGVTLEGTLALPKEAQGLVLFAHKREQPP